MWPGVHQVSDSVSAVVEVGDLEDDMDLSRIVTPGEKDYIRIKKYVAAKLIIEQAISPEWRALPVSFAAIACVTAAAPACDKLEASAPHRLATMTLSQTGCQGRRILTGYREGECDKERRRQANMRITITSSRSTRDAPHR